MNALIVVDMQNDFNDFGKIQNIGSIKMSENIKNFINKLDRRKWKIIFSKDWHPFNHISFQYWPHHCIKNTLGANYMDELKDIKKDYEIKKGTRKKKESFSCFKKNKKNKSKLNEYLKSNNIENVYICGLIKEICVLESAKDSVFYGYNTFIIDDFTICQNKDLYKKNHVDDVKEIISTNIK